VGARALGRRLGARLRLRRPRDDTGIAALLGALDAAGIALRDLRTEQSSLEDIFVQLVREES